MLYSSDFVDFLLLFDVQMSERLGATWSWPRRRRLRLRQRSRMTTTRSSSPRSAIVDYRSPSSLKITGPRTGSSPVAAIEHSVVGAARVGAACAYCMVRFAHASLGLRLSHPFPFTVCELGPAKVAGHLVCRAISRARSGNSIRIMITMSHDVCRSHEHCPL